MIHRLVTSRDVRSLAARSEALSARCISGLAASSSPTTAHHRPLAPSSALIVGNIHHIRRGRDNNLRRLSSSHDDFAPQKKHNLEGSEESNILDLIDSHVKSNRVMLYMKGSPKQPLCGFSATVVKILKSSGADFSSVNVLDYPEVREGVKKYAQWPTIPQLYVDGEFVGGCDIIQSMDESGELKELLASATKEGGDEKKD
mmetsp:Transcript_9956/g.21553  ORF Transcript_9956/g.21553 Transcript_9956/m.21553 type:complete len:201 (+) Transcript_9956:213-815(+)